MKAVVTAALVAAFLYTSANVARISGAVERLALPPTVIQYAMQTTVTLKHYDDNGNLVLEATFTKLSTETDAQFRARVAAEWAELVAQFGG